MKKLRNFSEISYPEPTVKVADFHVPAFVEPESLVKAYVAPFLVSKSHGKVTVNINLAEVTVSDA